MTEITKCLNEWNATIEALGSGEQSILIRKYRTNLNNFLLYPTVSYANKDDFINSFKDSKKDFVNNNILPENDNGNFLVKYYAEVESIIKRSARRIGSFDKYHIWTKKHVSSYLNGSDANIWLLRVYELEEPIYSKRSNGMVYANTSKKISIDNLKPVISDDEFEIIKEEINNKH